MRVAAAEAVVCGREAAVWDRKLEDEAPEELLERKVAECSTKETSKRMLVAHQMSVVHQMSSKIPEVESRDQLM